MLTPGSGVLVDVHAAGVSFPELLQSRGQYQLKPELPFVPGSEVALSAPGVKRGFKWPLDVEFDARAGFTTRVLRQTAGKTGWQAAP